MNNDGNGFDSIEQLHAKMDRGDLTAQVLLEATRLRAQDLNPRLHAFIEWLPVSQVRPANLSSRISMESENRLYGIPVAIKDLFDYAGAPTRAGSSVLPHGAAKMTATAVRRLEAAGAAILGKTHTVEFAFGG